MDTQTSLRATKGSAAIRKIIIYIAFCTNFFPDCHVGAKAPPRNDVWIELTIKNNEKSF
ncbi:hypothetical protein [Rickettsia endosymbiont of Orchestes rusci]|uniref:hypothetical protein n=1 Tax=Rickettsia endosymbiont of Orchestes rusci TaxID=3066250 RepID=UPI00313D3225